MAPKKRKPDKGHLVFTPARKRKFLVQLAKTGRKFDSCDHAGICGATMRNHIKNDKDFAEQVDEALDRYGEHLEEVAYKRHSEGVNKLIIHKGQVVTRLNSETGKHDDLYETNYSDGLLQQALQATIPHKYREKGDATELPEGTGNLVIIQTTPEETAQMLADHRKALIEDGKI